jgi:hypothetical protein
MLLRGGGERAGQAQAEIEAIMGRSPPRRSCLTAGE